MKSFKTKVIGIALAVTMLFGSSTVMAAPSADESTRSGATAVTLNTETYVNLNGVAGKWYKFTPSETRYYRI
ncbi:MAG: hypothetical protein J5685_09950 [Clostridiales bacterium]|nr:hypothetical protein [Clostridiales bacterium]